MSDETERLIAEAVEDYERRVAENRPYENAIDASEFAALYLEHLAAADQAGR